MNPWDHRLDHGPTNDDQNIAFVSSFQHWRERWRRADIAIVSAGKTLYPLISNTAFHKWLFRFEIATSPSWAPRNDVIASLPAIGGRAKQSQKERRGNLKEHMQRLSNTTRKIAASLLVPFFLNSLPLYAGEASPIQMEQNHLVPVMTVEQATNRLANETAETKTSEPFENFYNEGPLSPVEKSDTTKGDLSAFKINLETDLSKHIQSVESTFDETQGKLLGFVTYNLGTENKTVEIKNYESALKSDYEKLSTDQKQTFAEKYPALDSYLDHQINAEHSKDLKLQEKADQERPIFQKAVESVSKRIAGAAQSARETYQTARKRLQDDSLDQDRHSYQKQIQKKKTISTVRTHETNTPRIERQLLDKVNEEGDNEFVSLSQRMASTWNIATLPEHTHPFLKAVLSQQDPRYLAAFTDLHREIQEVREKIKPGKGTVRSLTNETREDRSTQRQLFKNRILGKTDRHTSGWEVNEPTETTGVSPLPAIS